MQPFFCHWHICYRSDEEFGRKKDRTFVVAEEEEQDPAVVARNTLKEDPCEDGAGSSKKAKEDVRHLLFSCLSFFGQSHFKQEKNCYLYFRLVITLICFTF